MEISSSAFSRFGLVGGDALVENFTVEAIEDKEKVTLLSIIELAMETENPITLNTSVSETFKK